MSLDISVTLAVGFRIPESAIEDQEDIERLCEELDAIYSTEGSHYGGELSYIVGPNFEDEGEERVDGNWTFGPGALFEKIVALAPELERIRAGLAERGFKDLRAVVVPCALLF